MLNEKRVKHMVQLAMYEHKDGAEELKASSFYKKDYISFNMLWSIIWMSIAYLIGAVLWVLVNMESLLNELSIALVLKTVGIMLVLYIVLLIVYIVLSRRFYRKKHAKAYHRVKKFKEGLTILEEMYQEERNNG